MKYTKEFIQKGDYDSYVANNSDRPFIAYVESLRKIYYNGMPTFEFYIDGEKMYAEEGMTWGVWVESRYNTLDLFWSGTYLVNKENTRKHLSWVFEYKLINEGYDYKYTYDVEIES